MTLDQVIANAEADLVTLSVTETKAALAALVPGSVAFFASPIGGFLFSALIAPPVRWFVANVIIKFFDVQGYYLYKSVQNNAQADAYENAIRNTKAATEGGDLNAIAQARAAQFAAFRALMVLT